MTSPTRWKDDPNFIIESGIDLNHEATGVGGYQLEAMRAAVIVGEIPIAASSTGMVAAAGASIALVGAGLLWFAFSPIPAADVAPAPTAAVAVIQAAPAAAAPAPQPVVQTVMELAGPPAIKNVGPHSEAPAPVAGLAGTDDAPDEDASESVVTPAGPAELQAVAAPGTSSAPGQEAQPPAMGDMAEHQAMYTQGLVALKAGDLISANETFGHYLEKWPQGVLRDEVLVSVLEVLVRQQSWFDAERVAASLIAMPELSERRIELNRVRAQALVHLGRCDEAMAVAAVLDRTDMVSIRKTCRAGVR